MGRARDQRGMTLVEVVIAAAILVVGLLALMSALSAGQFNVVTSGGQSKATTYARQLLEQLKNAPFDPGPTGGADTPEAGFARTWTIAPEGATGPPNQLARITVRVTWRAGWIQPQFATLETMRAE